MTFSAAIETLALIGMKADLTTLLVPLLQDVVDKTLQRNFNRLAKLSLLAAAEAAMAHDLSTMLLLQVVRLEAVKHPQDFENRLGVSYAPDDTLDARIRAIYDEMRGLARKRQQRVLDGRCTTSSPAYRTPHPTRPRATSPWQRWTTVWRRRQMSKAQSVVRLQTHANRTPTDRASATAARKLAHYLAHGRGRPAEQSVRPQRGIWYGEDGRPLTHEQVLQWVAEQGKTHPYTHQLILSVKEAQLEAAAYGQAMQAGGSDGELVPGVAAHRPSGQPPFTRSSSRLRR
ncbi:MAG: hypothetical protein IPH82_14470 [Chloroflexi bacterium]|nr:hypothetical protein [Chloroflexota bacterium]